MLIFEKKQKKLLLYILTLLGIFLVFKYMLGLILPFIAALLLARLIRPAAVFIKRMCRLPLTVGGAICLIFLLFALGTAMFFLIQALVTQTITLLQSFPQYQELLSTKLDKVCVYCDNFFNLSNGYSKSTLNSHLSSFYDSLRTDLFPKMTEQTLELAMGIFEFIALIVITLVATLLILKELEALENKFRGSKRYLCFHAILKRLYNTGFAYLKAQGIIMVLVAVACSIGLTLIGNSYAILFGIMIALLDALPLIGSVIILVPLGISLLLSGKYVHATIIFCVYLVCFLIRQFLEPKLLGKQIGISPILMLLSIYAGIRFFGILGFFLGPVAMIILLSVYDELKKQEANP